MNLLLIDMLGVKSKWREGPAAVAEAFDTFDGFVVDALTSTGVSPVMGGIDSDSTVLVFDDAVELFIVAQAIFRNAFDSGSKDRRWWLRGVVVPYEGQALADVQALEAPLGHLTRRHHSKPLLDAIAVEQSGLIKGMRLVVASAVVTNSLRQKFKVSIGDSAVVHPFRKLGFSGYPTPEDGWQDFLWMATDDLALWEQDIQRIADRMRYCARDRSEFEQAAATRVVFDQCRAILWKAGI